MKGTKLGNRKAHMSAPRKKKVRAIEVRVEPPKREDNVQVTLHGPSLAVGKKWLFLTDSLTSAILGVYLVISK